MLIATNYTFCKCACIYSPYRVFRHIIVDGTVVKLFIQKKTLKITSVKTTFSSSLYNYKTIFAGITYISDKRETIQRVLCNDYVLFVNFSFFYSTDLCARLNALKLFTYICSLTCDYIPLKKPLALQNILFTN